MYFYHRILFEFVRFNLRILKILTKAKGKTFFQPKGIIFFFFFFFCCCFCEYSLEAPGYCKKKKKKKKNMLNPYASKFQVNWPSSSGEEAKNRF